MIIISLILTSCRSFAQDDLDYIVVEPSDPDSIRQDPKELLETEFIAIVDFDDLDAIQYINNDDSTIYVSYGINNICTIDRNNPEYTPFSHVTNLTSKNTRIRSVAEKGDYLYVCSRGNGYGVHYEGKYPELLFPFENNLEQFNNKNLDNFDEYKGVGSAFMNESGSPSPSRWQHSLAMFKDTGLSDENHTYIRKQWSIASNGYISFWINPAQKAHSDILIMPIVWQDNDPVLSFAIDEDNLVGLVVGEKVYWGYYVLDDGWTNIKITCIDNTITLFVRGQECGNWKKSLVRKGSIAGNYFGIGLNTNSEKETVMIDDLAYNPSDIENVLYRNGELTVIYKKSMQVVCSYSLNMRCLDILIDGNTLYLGMIGGLNIYDISIPTKPKLIGINRESQRTWTYPLSSMTANYYYKVQADELQRMAISTDGIRKYLAAGSDGAGVLLYDITVPTSPRFIQKANVVPKVAVTNNDGSATTTYQYIQWGIVFNFPYIYSTVASYQKLQHNEYFDGPYSLVEKDDLIYGIMVTDISDSNTLNSRIIPIDEEDYPTYIDPDGDSRPNLLVSQGNYLVGNLSDKGIMLFFKNGMDTKYIGSLQMPNNGRTYALSSTSDGKIIVGDYYKGYEWNERKLYVLQFHEKDLENGIGNTLRYGANHKPIIYDIRGNLLHKDSTKSDRLQTGIYIIDKKKIYVR